MPSNFTGKDWSPFGFSAQNARPVVPDNQSTDIVGGSQAAVVGARVSRIAAPGFAAGIQTNRQPVAVVENAPSFGARVELFGSQIFERVIVIPRSVALGFVLTQTQFNIEVWNSFRELPQTLTAISIIGSGGVAVSNPFGLPSLFGALNSRTYQAAVPSQGPAQINQDIVFDFLSGIGGADTLVTGSRITVFSIAPDWSQGMKERISYLTDVLRGYSDNEQRRGLRQLARRSLAYQALTLNARDAAGMESLIWGWQNQPYGVPWWPDATSLTVSVGAGSSSIQVATVADRLFAAGGILVIWQDEYTFEALTINSIVGNTINSTSPTQFAWTAGPSALVIPIFLARLGSKVTVDRLFSGADSMNLEFVGEAQQPAPAPTISLTQYAGFDVLEVMPNWERDLQRNYARSLVVLDPQIGPITVDDKGGSAIVTQTFPWFLKDHPSVTTLRAFVLKRFGQLVPFWTPTWDQDLVLSSDVGATDTSIVIKSVYYTRFFFPLTSRRYIALIPQNGGSNVYRKITNAVDNGNGTETLTLDSPTGVTFSKTTTMVSFLTLSRLASDDAEIDWMTNDVAQAELQFQELPREVPA
jgi:hypothetical protein